MNYDYVEKVFLLLKSQTKENLLLSVSLIQSFDLDEMSKALTKFRDLEMDALAHNAGYYYGEFEYLIHTELNDYNTKIRFRCEFTPVLKRKKVFSSWLPIKEKPEETWYNKYELDLKEKNSIIEYLQKI